MTSFDYDVGLESAQIADNRAGLNEKNFRFNKKGSLKYSVRFVPESFSWIRVTKSFVVPRVKIELTTEKMLV